MAGEADEQVPERHEAGEYLTTADTTFEAEIIIERLAEAGIEAVPIGSQDPRVAMLGQHDIFVPGPDLERARRVLEVDESFTEAEVVKAEEEDAARRHISGPPD